MSPAARFASIEKAAKAPEGRKTTQIGDLAGVEGLEMGYFPRKLSPTQIGDLAGVGDFGAERKSMEWV